jgi:hypothetical protein
VRLSKVQLTRGLRDEADSSAILKSGRALRLGTSVAVSHERVAQGRCEDWKGCRRPWMTSGRGRWKRACYQKLTISLFIIQLVSEGGRTRGRKVIQLKFIIGQRHDVGTAAAARLTEVTKGCITQSQSSADDDAV